MTTAIWNCMHINRAKRSVNTWIITCAEVPYSSKKMNNISKLVRVDPILNLFFFEICSTYFVFFVVYLIPLHVHQIDPFLCSLMPKLSSSRWWALLPPPHSPSCRCIGCSSSFLSCSVLSRCLSSDSTINIEKYRLYRQFAAAVFWWRSSVAMNSLLDCEFNTHRVDHMLAPEPPPSQGKTATIDSYTRNPNEFTKY